MRSAARSTACTRRADVRNRIIQWVDGRPVRLQVATDITARIETRERERQQEEKVQLTSRLIAMGEMASSLAHELNQPLTAISNYSMGTVARVRRGLASGQPTDAVELLGMLQKTSAQAERAALYTKAQQIFHGASRASGAAASARSSTTRWASPRSRRRRST